ncbi:hypothetical protein IC582_021057 [Cucumis melo]
MKMTNSSLRSSFLSYKSFIFHADETQFNSFVKMVHSCLLSTKKSTFVIHIITLFYC